MVKNKYMNIRNATYRDAPAIKLLLEVLGYTTTLSMLIGQIESLFGGNDHQLLVFELNKDVAGFASIHFLPQLGFGGEIVIISYLSVDTIYKDKGIDKELEDYITLLALKRKCDRIQVHFSDWRTPVQKFYEQQGYREYPKYYSKRLVYGE